MLSLLDEACSLPMGSDAGYVEMLSRNFEAAHGAFSKPTRKGGGRGREGRMDGEGESAGGDAPQFCVRHYAGEVVYTCAGWIDKNKGALSPELGALMANSEVGLISDLFTEAVPGHKGEAAAPELQHAGKKKAAATVLGRFRASLKSLFTTLDATSARYVRCLKPNASKARARASNLPPPVPIRLRITADAPALLPAPHRQAARSRLPIASTAVTSRGSFVATACSPSWRYSPQGLPSLWPRPPSSRATAAAARTPPGC